LIILHYGDDKQEDGDGMWNPAGGFRNECEEMLAGYVEPLSKVRQVQSNQLIVQLESIEDPVTGQRVTPHQIPYTAIVSDVTLGTFSRKINTTIAEIHPDVPPPPVIAFVPYNTATFALYV